MCEREGERNFCNERLRRGKRKEERERDIYIVRMIQRKRDISEDDTEKEKEKSRK